jgi:hypothetical protein
MGAKIKSKTQLLNTFLIFGTVFCAFGFKVWKSTNMTLNFFFKSKEVAKNAEIHAYFKSAEKVCKKCTKKSYKQNKFDEHE